MNRETENRFRVVPQINKPRKVFEKPYKRLQSFKTGELTPILVTEVLPGDTFKIDMAAVVRMLTPLYPVMDDLIMDITAWYVPNRLTWTHWTEFLGENKLTAWEQPVEYEIPQTTAPNGGWAKGTLADKMGIPTKVDGLSVSSLPFRGYALIWNEFWRDQNLKDAIMVNLDDATTAGSNGTGDNDTYVNNVQKGGMLAIAAKTHGYLTSALPDIQKGEPILIPVNSRSGSYVPVVARSVQVDSKYLNGQTAWIAAANSNETLPNGQLAIMPYHTSGDDHAASFVKTNTGGTGTGVGVTYSNLWADLSAGAEMGSIGTIEELMQAMSIQRILEAFRHGGTRYTEILQNIWSVQAPDQRLQRPEYLGGERIPIVVNSVIQRSRTEETGSPLGTTGAFSNTAFTREYLVNKSFVEHGYLYILGVIRIKNRSYQQRIPKLWSRKTKFDFYWPEMANLADQRILNKEIYAQGTSEDDEVFGYQERWSEYKYGDSIVMGELRTNADGSLDAWHYADYYEELPTLSSEWIDEGTAEVNRTLAVSDEISDQFFGDFLFNSTETRMMPIYADTRIFRF